MKHSNLYTWNIRRTAAMVLLCCMILLLGPLTNVQAQPPKADLDQVRNGTPIAPISPGNWVNGNAGAQNSHYIESHSIPYRVVMTNLPIGTEITIQCEYDVRHGGKHAIEFMTHYQHLNPHFPVFGHDEEVIDPRIGHESATPATPNTWPIPVPPMTNTPIPGEPAATFLAIDPTQRLMSLFGGNFSGANPIAYVGLGDLSAAQSAVSFSVTFIPTHSTAILAWGGHIATRDTWGEGNTAVNINGSPYHTRLNTWTLSNLGQQDRSLNADAVYYTPPCDFTGPESLCLNETGTFTLDMTNSSWIYSWSLIQNGTNAYIEGSNSGTSVNVNSGTQPGSFTVVATVSFLDNGFLTSSICSTEVSLNESPSCDISGSDVVCPGSTTVFSGPADDISSYAWSISGDGQISGPAGGSSVNVIAGSGCLGSYTLTLTTSNADGCESTCQKTVTVNDTQAPVISGVGQNQTISCNAQVVFSSPSASDNCDPNPSLDQNDVTTPGSCPQSYSVTRTWTATDACGNVATAAQTISVVDNTAPVISGVGGPQTISCSNQLVFSTPSASDDCDPNPSLNQNDVTTPGSCPQSYSMTRTWTATDACGNVATAAQTISVVDNTAPVISGVGGPETVYCPDEPKFSTPSASDNCDPNPALTSDDEVIHGECENEYTVIRTWTATDVCGNVTTASQAITKISNTPPEIIFPEIPLDGDADYVFECGEEVIIGLPEIYSACDPDADLTITRSDGLEWGDPFGPGITEVCFEASDVCGNLASMCITVEVLVCGDVYCSLTQGFYGNPGGTHCDGSSTTDLVDALLGDDGLVVGSGSNTMYFGAGEATCLIGLLPGGGSAKTITGDNTCASHPGIQKKNGKIFNVLLAQTITLGLNLRLDSELGGLVFSSNVFWTVESDGCGEGEENPVPDTELSFTIPQSVFDYLFNTYGSVTPEGIFNLANLALGGANPSGASLSDIANAADAINRGFDECRFLASEPVEKSSPISGDISADAGIKLSAYPNPFKSVANISFTVAESGHARLDVYSLNGMRVATLFDGYAEAGQAYTFEFTGVDNLYQATYVTVISTQSGTKYQQILKSK